MNQNQAKEKIKELVEKYNVLSESERNKYNEEETKNYFIRPLFEALGWDFAKSNEVAMERGSVGKRADYEFKLNGIPKVYLEAKSIRTDLNLEQHARQAINYAWNKGVTWAVLTDFESIKVFNAQGQSKLLADKLVFEIPVAKYLTDERLWLLSKESFLEGGLDQYAEKYAKKIKKQTVNESLFGDLRVAREHLTESFGMWNKEVDKETLDEGVQKILDRLVFVRVLEDRGLEPPILKQMIHEREAKGTNVQLFDLLIKKFRELDEYYNSNLFSPHACEKWVEYDDKLKKVILLLYGGGTYEYDFKQIPADVLGGVYESYLSYIAQKLIEVDKEGKSGKLLKVEDKKEMKEKSRKKRKEQGIYYTPKFIVDYIVKNTLGEKLKEVKTVNELKKIKVLDPACGSGSFLTVALETINEKYKEFNSPGDQTTKTTILLENIYGVDLDAQAVELAHLNLLIDALDTRAKLPKLAKNIKNGNSLISGAEEELKKYFGDSWRNKKPFDWKDEFSDVFKQGGFDVIIGNPPWGANIDSDVKYFEEKYPNSTKSYKDIYKIFIDKSLSLLKSGGVLGFIVPNTFLYQPRYEDIKKVVNKYENFVINLGEKIFHNVQLPSCILIVIKQKGTNKFVADLTREKRELLASKIWKAGSGSPQDKAVIKDTGVTFDEVFLLKDAGINYQAVSVGKGAKGSSKLSEQLFYEGKQESKEDMEYWKGSHINRYFIQDSTGYFVRTNYQNFKQANEQVILNKNFFVLSPKIIWRQTASSIIATIDVKGIWWGRSIIGAILSEKYKNSVDIYYALVIFNSKYINYLYHQKVLETGKVFPQVKLKYLRDLPFVIGNKKQQKLLLDLAKKMIDLNKQFHSTPKNSEKYNSLKSEIEKTDKHIDQLVYKLYGLTPKEVKIVEGEMERKK